MNTNTLFTVSMLSVLTSAACGQAPTSKFESATNDETADETQAPAATPVVTYPALKDQFCDATLESGEIAINYAVVITDNHNGTYTTEYWAMANTSDYLNDTAGETSQFVTTNTDEVTNGATLTVQQMYENSQGRQEVGTTWTIQVAPPTMTVTAVGATTGTWTVAAPTQPGQLNFVNCGLTTN